MPTSMSIGMFDGLHLGHRAIIDQARDLSGPDGSVVVVTFEPSPAVILNPSSVPPRLMTAHQRERALLEAGVDEVVILEPTAARLGMSPVAFIEEMVDRIHPDHIIEGSDFRFGVARSGDMGLLRSEGVRLDFEVHEAKEVEATLPDGSRVPARSSTIRGMLLDGNVEAAACLLNQPWQVEGQVIQGAQRGREIGCPTANLDLGELLCPADGVYAGIATLESGDEYMAAISIGTNPTFEDGGRSFEVHLLDFQGQVGDYGWTLRVGLRHRLRDQIVYESIDELVEAIEGDLRDIRSLLSV
ncbi:MAG: riboflavin biosynthesis protein RibF [Phycisphaerae bacterium]|nr:riboflavin biosynthesis protein RibF [Phycisphaerae bacterium]